MLTDFERKQIVNELADRMARLLDERLEVAPRPVLNVRDSARYIGKPVSGFHAWRKRWRVQPCAHGRYNRNELDEAMKREGRGVFVGVRPKQAVA